MKTQLQIRTEFSFGWVFGPIKKVVDRLKEIGCEAAAITDRNSCYGHVAWAKACKLAGIKPLFGVELAFVYNTEERQKRQNIFWLPIVARNNSGLKEIYSAIEEATANFYMLPRLPFKYLNSFSQDVILFSGMTGLGDKATLGPRVIGSAHPAARSMLLDGKIVPVSDNYMIRSEDRSAYEILARRNRYDRPSPMHILDEWELRNEIDIDDEAFALADRLAEECDATIQIATNIKFQSNKTLKQLCIEGISWRGLSWSDEYQQRLDKELGLIQEKQYEDYFFVIADMIKYAKQNMLVGPARGSSCGSLVCYLLGITDIDPIPHGLIFERFIDVTRYDLPDIDIDFQDDKRYMVFDYLTDKYGKDNVARLGTVLRYKPKSVINQTAKALGIPEIDTIGVKDAMLKRSSGDSRAGLCILDTFSELEVGQRFIEKYPAMKIAGDLENHASHTGKHAAGVIITNEPIINYVAKDVRTNTTQIDKYDAEQINLMKIDALGLKTLSIIDETLKLIDWDYSHLLNHPLDDDKAFEVLRKHLFCGIFQFEGQALQTLARRLHVDRFDDIACLTALARPGPFASGASNEWIQRRMGNQTVTHHHPLMEKYTGDTYGLIIYQETVMQIVKEIGNLSWEDTSTLRKAMSKSLGVEYFDQFKIKFVSGAKEKHDIDENTATTIWNEVNTMGSWCLSGDTVIRNPFPKPSSKSEYTIAELYEREKTVHKTWYNTNGKKPQQIYCYNGEVLIPIRNLGVTKSGIRKTYLMKLETGESIRATLDHQILTTDGYVSLGELKIGDQVMIGSKTRPHKSNLQNHRSWNIEIFTRLQYHPICELCNIKPSQDVHHINEDRSDNRQENLQALCKKCHRNIHGPHRPHEVGKQILSSKIIFIGDPKEEMTYDISMPAPYHNFLANNIVVHNCFNKSHAVAYGTISYFCCVLKAHFPIEFALANIRNTHFEDSIKRYLRELDRIGYGFKPYDLEKSQVSWSYDSSSESFIGGLTNLKGIGKIKAKNILLARDNGLPYTLPKELTTPFDNLFEGREHFDKIVEEKYNLRQPKINLIDLQDNFEGEIRFTAKLLHRNERSLNETMFLVQRNNVYVSNDKWLNILLEDDTATVYATISRFKFPSMGMKMLNEHNIGDWFLFKGIAREGRRIYVERFDYLGAGGNNGYR